MTDTPQTVPFTIKSRYDDSVVYVAKTATTLRDAVVEAVGCGANLSGAYLSGANLSGANLSGAYLSGAYLSGAYLSGANLSIANLSGAYLSGAYLSGAYLRGANLSSANLSGANLSGANLSGAYLSDANLRGANLRGANLSDANLSGAYLSGEKIIATASIQFTGHGQCGRTLTAVKTEDAVHLWCGCFHGTPDDLRAFIAGDNASYAKTRTLALGTVLALLDAKNEEN